MSENVALQKLIALHTKKPRQKTESTLLGKLQAHARKCGARLWRNNVGTLQDRHGRYVTYGLCVGSSDLIGYSVRVITPDMVGQKVCIFTAIEAKAASGRATERQMEFVKHIREAGGIAQVVRSVLELEVVLAQMKSGRQ